MIKFKVVPGESLRAVSPISLFLVDDFTGQPPFGALNPDLKQVVSRVQVFGITIEDLQPVAVRARLGTSGVLTYPNLLLTARAEPYPQPNRTFVLTLAPDYYVPYYRRRLDRLEYQATPYNHAVPDPGQVPAAVLQPPANADDAKFLLPSIRYPFPAHVTVLYGQVIRKRQMGQPDRPGPYVRVRIGATPGALTDADGWFALPLQTAAATVALDISSERPTSEIPAFPTVQKLVPWTNRTTYLPDPIELPV